MLAEGLDRLYALSKDQSLRPLSLGVGTSSEQQHYRTPLVVQKAMLDDFVPVVCLTSPQG